MPVLPLGNYSLGLAALYAIVAPLVLVARLADAARRAAASPSAPRSAPIGALGSSRSSGSLVRWPARRGAQRGRRRLVAVAAVEGASRIDRLGVATLSRPGEQPRRRRPGASERRDLRRPRARSALGAAVLPFVRGRGPLGGRPGYAGSSSAG